MANKDTINHTTLKPHKNIRGAEYYAQALDEQKPQTALIRLREFVDWAKSNKMCNSLYDFESQCGLSNRYISNSIANGKGNIGSEMLGRIVRRYPMLNLVWICTGEGNMLTDVDYSLNADYKKAYEAAMAQIEALNRIISRKGHELV